MLNYVVCYLRLGLLPLLAGALPPPPLLPELLSGERPTRDTFAGVVRRSSTQELADVRDRDRSFTSVFRACRIERVSALRNLIIPSVHTDVLCHVDAALA